MFNEEIYTLEEVSEYLKVPVDVLRREIAAGRLRAMNVGGLIRIREFALADYKNVASQEAPSDGSPPTAARTWLRLSPSTNFDHTWPDGKVELFSNVQEGAASYVGREYQIKLGFTVRESAGRRRTRCLVIVDRYPTVEFVKADDQDGPGSLASIIKDRAGKQVPPNATPPPEYTGIDVGRYRDIVDGPGAPNGLAVICRSNDFETMVKHALIRHRFREARAKEVSLRNRGSLAGA